MAQHDYVIANGTGAAIRSDLNNGLAAIVSNNSGATEPATMYAYQWWADTTTGLLKLRNAANNAWVTVGTLASANLGLAALASPTFTGTVTAPTFTASTAVNIPLGSAGSPTLFFTGDTNTGIYSPAADTIAFAEGGVEAMRITSSGRVGIGNTNPSSALSVAAGATTPWLQIKGTTAGYDYAEFLNSGAAILGYIGAGGSAIAGGATSDFVFSAQANLLLAAGNGTERARIDSSGRLLVGTSTASGNSIIQVASGGISIRGSTSGYSEIVAPAIAGDQTFTLPGTGGTIDRLNRAGNILQVVNFQTGAVATGTTIIPMDDTIPQNTEGNEYMTLAITPTNASSKLLINVQAFLTHSASNSWMIGAIFQDSTANTLATFANYQTIGTAANILSFNHYITAGTTSLTTFKFRAGGSVAGTTTFNGNNGGRLLGGTAASSITIKEIAA